MQNARYRLPTVSPKSSCLYFLSCSSHKYEFLFFHNSDCSLNKNQFVFTSLKLGTWNETVGVIGPEPNRIGTSQGFNLGCMLESLGNLLKLLMLRLHPISFISASLRIGHESFFKASRCFWCTAKIGKHCARCLSLITWSNITINFCQFHSSQCHI